MIDVPGRHPRMSVEISSYNHGPPIPEALAAISRQTTAPFEVVAVDDGSTGDSLARLQSLAGMPWLRTRSRRRHWQVPRRGQ
jgi:glycosyltransferase involved in cell wall biosynthesis